MKEEEEGERTFVKGRARREEVCEKLRQLRFHHGSCQPWEKKRKQERKMDKTGKRDGSRKKFKGKQGRRLVSAGCPPMKCMTE